MLSTLIAKHVDDAWAIRPERLRALLDAGGHLSAADLAQAREAALEAASRAQNRQTRGSVAVVPIVGSIEKRADIWTMLFGGTSTTLISAALDEIAADASIKGAVLDIDSPGGVVAGTPELAEQIRKLSAVKPVVAVANDQAASAAFWLGSQATEFSVTPSGQVGSIGVIWLHAHVTDEDVTYSILRSPERKAEATPYEPLSEEARADMQAKVDAYARMFEAAVAKGRGVPVATVRQSYGQGRMLLASDALKAGMVDRIETLDEAIARVARGGVRLRSAIPAAEEPPPTNPIEPDPARQERAARLWDIELAARRARAQED